MTNTLRVATFNIHKGFSHFNWRMAVHELRDKLQALSVDILFLQEVQGAHNRHHLRYKNWPAQPQYEFLADNVWTEFAYAKNAVYDHGHHGNAILSRYSIVNWASENISSHRFENRGLLHCELQIPDWPKRLHCINVHFGLLAAWRRQQLQALCSRIERLVPPDEPLIIAGDFNDWRRQASVELADALRLEEVFEVTRGRPARSFPSSLPMFYLDRIYVRGLQIKDAHVHHGRAWSMISDHAPLSTTLVRI